MSRLSDDPWGDALAKIAARERETVERILGEHLAGVDCAGPGCATCSSLGAHLDRAREQEALLTAPPALDEPLFDA